MTIFYRTFPRELANRVRTACETTSATGAITYENIVTAFVIVVVGIVVALMTLIFENMFKVECRKRQQRRTRQQRIRPPTVCVTDLD